MNHKYKNPPLVESVFEIYFSSKSWSSIIPGLYYSLIKEKFPIISQNRVSFGVILDGNGIKIGGGNQDLIQFKNEIGDTVIQLSSNMLTVNKLPYYEGWESYIKVIEFAVTNLKEVLQIDIIDKIGLKTLNKIDINYHSLQNFKKYFKVFPIIPFSDVEEPSSIQLNFLFPIIENKEFLSVIFSTLSKEPNYEVPVLFQYYISRISEVPEDYIKWLETAHILLYKTFQDSLTIESVNKFDNVE